LQVTINSASTAAVHEGYAVGLSADGNTVLVGGQGYDVSAGSSWMAGGAWIYCN